MKKAVSQIFDDLDAYRNFCREFGRVFDEAHLLEGIRQGAVLAWVSTL
jgi:hypothetical protein